MRVLTMWFDKGLMEFNYPTQVGTEYFDFAELKQAACEMFKAPSSASMLQLDFERESVKYQDGNTVITELRPGLSAEEERVLSFLGYVDVNMNNTIGLVEAFVNGEVSESLFQLLMGVEGMSNDPNQGVKDFLKGLEEQQEGL